MNAVMVGFDVLVIQGLLGPTLRDASLLLRGTHMGGPAVIRNREVGAISLVGLEAQLTVSVSGAV